MTYMPKFQQSSAESHSEYDASRATLDREATLLEEQSRAGLAQLLTTLDLAAPESVYLRRLETELQIIKERACSSYFLIVADYVRWARDKGIAVGPGRGSGPCSLVGYAMGITSIDPIKYQLPFERFVNPARDVLPDFDIDFCEERSGEVTTYLQTTYGTDRVAQISSDATLPQPARLVIGDRPLSELIPVYTDPNSGLLATELTTAQIADAGLVQFNVIDQKAITIIQRKVEEITRTEKALNLAKIPLNDSDTYRFLCAGEASNIPVLDGRQYKDTLQSIQPTRFDHLCAVIALCYPDLQGSAAQYAERKQHSESVSYFHPAMKHVTSETYGLILYQEQLMHLTHEVAGFTMSQADLFRRALKKPDRDALLVFRKQFIQGAGDSGFSETDAAALFDHIALSGRKTFNKSHAVAFALIAYQIAWLKANYPH